MNIPKHIAFIPDGNRRWAKKQGILASLGHEAGKNVAEKIIRAAQEAGIQNLTFWGCSVGNVTKRDTAEVQFLYTLFKEQFTRLLNDPDTHAKGVKVRVLGEWKQFFPSDLQAVIEKTIEKTAKYDRLHLTFMMAYSGVHEMLAAINEVSHSGQPVTHELVKNHLYTKDLPPVDLVVRTGNEPHLSEGFMMWDTADAQLYFSEKMWPDFSEGDLQAALRFYSERERRLGK